MRTYRNHRLGNFVRRVFDNHFLIFDLGMILAAVAAYAVNRRFAGVLRGRFMRGHFNDLMAGMLFPAYVNIWLALGGYRLRGWIYPLLCTLAAGCVWEFVAPLYRPQSVSDPLDLVAYLAGTLIYCVVDHLAMKRRGENPADKPK